MHNNSTYLSVVIPVYGCDSCLYELYSRLKKTLSRITENYEIIMVNDSSPDSSWEIIKNLFDKDKRVKGINLSKNFGQHYAVSAGLDIANGQWIIVMDCDLQDKPEEIPKLYSKALEGFDIVLGRRLSRRDSIWKKISSKLFYLVFSYLTDTKQDGTIGNFGIYNKKVIDSVKAMKENLRFFPTMIKWVGFSSTSIPIEHNSRQKGRSNYSLKKLLNLALDVIISFSDKPLRITVQMGLLISFLSAIYAVYITIRALFGNVTIEGWSSLIVSIWFLSGLIIFVLGIIGIYVGKIFDEVKKRPLYLNYS